MYPLHTTVISQLTEHSVIYLLPPFGVYNMLARVFFALDVVTIEKTGENFRLIYDTKGRFTVHRITPEESSVSLVGD